MNQRIRGLLLAALICGLGVLSVADAAEPCPAKPKACEPGYQMVEEIVLKEVVRKVCKVVPEVKKHKRIVYTVKCEDYCLPKCGGLFAGCGDKCNKCGFRGPGACCPMCEEPRTRRVLVKKEVIEEEHTFKCVVECVTELVPVKVCKKVPCNPPPCPPGHLPPEK